MRSQLKKGLAAGFRDIKQAKGHKIPLATMRSSLYGELRGPDNRGNFLKNYPGEKNEKV